MIVKDNVTVNEDYDSSGVFFDINVTYHEEVFPYIGKCCIDFFFRDRYKLQPQKNVPVISRYTKSTSKNNNLHILFVLLVVFCVAPQGYFLRGASRLT